MDDSEDDSGTTIRFALNDLEKYRSVIKNNYKKYLDKKYVEQLLKKIGLIEHELKVKEYYINQYSMSLQEEHGKSR
jgi:hypoxanthine phosphoribosyltransferase